MNSLELHGLSDGNASDSDFVIESATNPEDRYIDRAITIFEASQKDQDESSSVQESLTRDAISSPPTISLVSDDDDQEVSLLESIQVLKAKEKQLTSTAAEKRATPRMRRYFDSPDLLKCFNCGGRGHLSQACPEENSKPCFICGHPGHLERTCPNQLCFRCHLSGHAVKDCRASGKAPLRVCSRCGSLKHTLLKCTYQVRADSDELVSVRCFICGSFGHLCCKNSRKLSKQPQFCSNCASRGHWHFDCPQQNRMTSYYDSLKSKPLTDNGRGPVCFTCTKRGHWSRDCPNNVPRVDNTPSSESEWCFVCQVVGHRAGECPGNIQEVSKQENNEKYVIKKRQRESTASAATFTESKQHKQKEANGSSKPRQAEGRFGPNQTKKNQTSTKHRIVGKKKADRQKCSEDKQRTKQYSQTVKTTPRQKPLEIVLRDGRWVS